MSEIHESTGSYALDALDSAELAEFEAHLATCDACQEEVADFCETAAELSLLSLATPPASLRASILDAIQDVPQLPADDDFPLEEDIPTVQPLLPVSGPPANGGARRALPGTEVADEPDPSPVDELALRRQRRRTRVLSGLVAAMLVLAVGLGGVIYTMVQERQTQIAAATLEDQLYRAPDAELVIRPIAGGGQATFVVSKGQNRALFIGTDLPDPGADRRFQLWTGKGDPSSDTTISGIARDVQISDRASDIKVFFSGDVATSDFLALNLEPVGSTPAKPTPPVLAAGLI